jgi:hypothetical protein
MSPREKHIPDDARRTTVCLTAEDRAAIRWISEVRRAKKSKRTTSNDILIDALWHFLEKTEGKTRNQKPDSSHGANGRGRERQQKKVTVMPKPKNKH